MKELYKLFGKAEQEVEGMFSIANIFNEMGKENPEGEKKQKKELNDEDLLKLLLK